MQHPHLHMLGLLCLASPALAQTRTPMGSPQKNVQASPLQGLSLPITFSEFPNGTSISNQYSSLGIIFGGDSPFITSDGSNPTSPVLSGTPTFSGAIEGHFVDPDDGQTPVVVKSFSFDAGFFNELGSTRLEWYDPDGDLLGQVINPTLGIVRLEGSVGNIASFRIEIFGNRPAGYAIDNFNFEPIGPSILFREKRDISKDGSWLLPLEFIPGFDSIPGFDHVGFQSQGLVYESHPNYPAGTYTTPDGTEMVSIQVLRGVQAQFTPATFEHDSTSSSSTPVIGFETLPVPTDELADQMRAAIEPLVGSAGFQFLCRSNFDLDCLELQLSPAAQKGADNTYTCCGLVEYAAEQAGHMSGEGFIPDALESFDVGGRTIPMLSPWLLNVAMKNELSRSTFGFLEAWFDPVDFIVTDPLGRRIGFTQATGELREIPGAAYTGDGLVEQLLIPFALPGIYTAELVGLGERVEGGLVSATAGFTVERELAMDERTRYTIVSEPYPGSPGDLDANAVIDQADLDLLFMRLNSFATGVSDPGDPNRDGRIDNADVDILELLIALSRERILDFDTGAESMLVNGSLVTQGTDWSLAASGSNLGAALFDSHASGPNAKTSDLDLLVGSGRILILQGTSGFKTPGVFTEPNDAIGGGTLEFTFDSPREFLSVDLIDIDTFPFLPQDAQVRLFDDSGRERLYVVPEGWTGDAAIGESGVGTLNLTTLTPQPGRSSTATATEAAGFNATSVTRLVVDFASSAALDNVRYRMN